MSAQVGIPHYKDLVNKEKIHEFKELINKICLIYAKLSSKDALDNRDSQEYDKYTSQYSVDMMNLKTMCKYAQDLVEECNDTMFLIADRGIAYHQNEM